MKNKATKPKQRNPDGVSLKGCNIIETRHVSVVCPSSWVYSPVDDPHKYNRRDQSHGEADEDHDTRQKWSEPEPDPPQREYQELFGRLLDHVSPNRYTRLRTRPAIIFRAVSRGRLISRIPCARASLPDAKTGTLVL